MATVWRRNLKQKVKKYLADYFSAHDFYHLLRVKNNAFRIAREMKYDEDILFAGALLHDIGYKNNGDQSQHHHLFGIKIAKVWLRELNFPQEKITDVLEIIRLHDNFSWGHDHEPTSHIETKIIQDADRIDAIGAIGIARLAHFFGEKGWPIYSPAGIPKTKKVLLNHSLLDQLQRSALKIWPNLNFPISKKMAKKRYQFIQKFYRELNKEILK